MKMYKFTIATAHSEHFTFEGVGENRQHAKQSLRAVLVAHDKQYKTATGWIREMMLNAEYRNYETGMGYRDGERVI